ncbi:NADH-quinone oxidoreductase subunit NuoN [Limibacillus sp. MBR-115]|jgi:NADH-quinone oxidoreductase subunit N|uniref:NADH-quinone oxidoreductase subunit NuoN n=1 Tax=Limibacillus sp. MBR-115 TaxID=3156465 RepID=UPI0033991099
MIADLELTRALPELFLAVASMGLLMLGVFHKKGTAETTLWPSVGVLTLALLLLWFQPEPAGLAFNGLFVTDGFATFMKSLVLIGAIGAMFLSLRYVAEQGMDRFEFPVLLVLSSLGMLMMISAGNLMSLYVGLELQSLALYVVAAFRRDSQRSTEAGLKYFILGALSSAMLLYGCSLVYGFAGATDFVVLANVFEAAAASGEAPSLGLIIGVVFVMAGLAFKISAVPFHMWTPDVYEGAPTAVTAFFATAPKVAAMALFVRVLVGPFGDLIDQWQQIVIFISIASMTLGAFAAIQQTNIKRLMAYSSIGHMGYALVGLAAGSEQGVQGIMIYMAIYLVMNLGTFAVILSMRHQGRMLEGIDDLRGLSKTNPMVALAMAIFMFSMAGIPPLAGFFGKLYVFMAAINAELYTLAVIGVLASVVGAFYYLRIIKLMYFDEPVESLDEPPGRPLGLVLLATAVAIVFFFVVPGPLVESAGSAAASLFAG